MPTFASDPHSYSDKREHQRMSCCGRERFRLYINVREHLQWFGPIEGPDAQVLQIIVLFKEVSSNYTLL